MASKSFSVEDLRSAVPTTGGTISLIGLDGDVRVVRDKHGIPHIRATSTHDAFFGQGFATAQDRLWHMDYDRRRAYGRWAEFVGESGIEHDKQMRRFQLHASTEGDWDALNDDTKAMFEASSSGPCRSCSISRRSRATSGPWRGTAR